MSTRFSYGQQPADAIAKLNLMDDDVQAAIAVGATVASIYDQFDDRYLGSKASAPTLDNDGNALIEGALYWDSVAKAMRAWSGSAWSALVAASASNVVNTPSGNIAATTVQAALNELDSEKQATAALVASTGSSIVGHIASGTGAVATTVQAKLRQTVSVKDFGAVGDGITNDAAAIQAAINAVSSIGGGVVKFPTANYNLGTTGLIIYQNIVLQGDVGRYAGATTRGVRLIYSGAANAIYGQNILDAQIINIALDMTTATGSVCVGVNLNGVWKTTIRNVTVFGMSVTKGYSILFDTNTGGGPWGGQHNLLEQVECPDGIIRISGAAPNNGVTTTVFNTIRGYMYQINYSQVTLINATAEQWPSGQFGFNFSNSAQAVMIGCDIENTSTTAYAIAIDVTSVVREFGTVWSGFAGSNTYKMGGSGTMAPLRSYGGGMELDYYALTANTPVTLENVNDINANGYISRQLVATNVTGGTQTGYEKKSRLINGASVVSHELLDNFRLYTTKSCTISATSVLTIPIPSNVGVRVRVLAYGADPGNVSNVTYSQNAICNNNAGTLTVATDTQLKSPNVAGGISFVISTTNLVVSFANTTNTATIFFYIEIDGPITSYTKN